MPRSRSLSRAAALILLVCLPLAGAYFFYKSTNDPGLSQSSSDSDQAAGNSSQVPTYEQVAGGPPPYAERDQGPAQIFGQFLRPSTVDPSDRGILGAPNPDIRPVMFGGTLASDFALLGPGSQSADGLWNTNPKSVLTTRLSSSISNGLKVVVTGERWVRTEADPAYTSLAVRFEVEHVDGSAVTFRVPQGAVSVTVTPEQGDPSDSITELACPIDGGSAWCSTIRWIDPRSRSVRLVINVRDPSLSETQVGSVQTRVDFSAVPVPIGPDIYERLQDSYVTPLGASLFIKGLCLSTANPGHMPAIMLDMAILNPRGTDCIANATITVLDDRTKKYIGSGSFNSQITSTPNEQNGICYLLSPGHKFPVDPLKLRIQVSESSETTLRAVKWSTLCTNLPVSSIPLPAKIADGNSRHTVQVDNVNFTVENPAELSEKVQKLFWIKPQSQNDDWKVIGGGITGPTGGPIRVGFDNVQRSYWHEDGSPIRPGESSAVLTMLPVPEFALELAAQSYLRRQQQMVFSGIAIPRIGESRSVNQGTDRPSILPIELSTICVSPVPISSNATAILRPCLTLMFKCILPAGSKITVDSVRAFDDRMRPFKLSLIPIYGTEAPFFVGQTHEVHVSMVSGPLPDVDSQTFTLKLQLSEENPNRQPVFVSINSDGDLKQVYTPIFQTAAQFSPHYQ